MQSSHVFIELQGVSLKQIQKRFCLQFEHWDGVSRKGEKSFELAHVPQRHQYSAGTSFSAPLSITEKLMEVYYLDEWIIITLYVAGFLHPAIL